MRKMYFFLSLIALTLFALPSMAQITVTATAGTLGPTVYTTLNNAVNAINAGTHQGVINLSVTASTTETVQSILNSSGTGAASYTSITIKPAAATTPTISGTISPSILQLRGADNVTIDGSNTVGGTTRDLTLRNNSTATTETVLFISSASAADGATGNVIKNCNFQGFSAATTVAGILTGNTGAVGFAALAGNNNNTIQNNSFTNVQNGIYLFGCATAPFDQNWTITGNNFTTMGFRGMILQNCTNFTISKNIIAGVVANTASTPTGIMLFGSFNGGNVFGNEISGVNNTAPDFGCNGIWLIASTTASNINVYNNTIANIWSTSGWIGSVTWEDNGYGIVVTPNPTGGGYNIYHNTISLATNSTTGSATAAVLVETGLTAGGIRLVDNIFVNRQTAGATIRTGVYSTAPNTVFAAIDYNDYFATSGILGNIGGINRNTIAQVQTGFGSNLNSITLDPTFVSATNLRLQHIVANDPLRVGTPLALVTTDIDGTTRSASAPTLGAYELPGNTITYTNLVNTCSTGDITLSGVVINSGTGVPLTGTLVPRIYFRKGAGAWFSAAGVLTSGTATSGTWSFTINTAAMGGVAGGDVISYYVIAQTTGGVVFAWPMTGLVATDVNTVTTHPTTPNTYTVQAVSLSGLTTTQSRCYNASALTTATYPYTGSAGTPNQYTLTWSPAGPTDVAAFTAFPASPLTVNIPAGTATGTYTGTLTIRNATTLCTNTYTLTLTINPLPAPITGSTIACVGASTTLANVTTGGGWSVTPASVATIGVGTGVLTGAGLGTATVTYTASSGCFSTTVVTISAPPAATITGTGAVCVGATTTLANATPGGAWSSTAASIASAGASSGVITGVGAGTATISYSITGCTPVSTVVTVNANPEPITGALGVCNGGTSTLTTASTGGTWSSSNTSVATIGTAGDVAALAVGSSTITYQFTGTSCYTTAVLNVYPVPGAITGAGIVCAGSTTTLSNSTPLGVWSSSVPAVASIGSSSGVVTGLTNGATVITYALGSCIVTTTMSVNTAPSTITGGTIVCTGKTITLGNSVAGGVWSSTTPSVASISSTGVVTGVTPGTTVISYTTVACAPATALVSVNLNPALISGITNVCEGSSTSLSNATPGGVWTSSNPFAPVSSSGVVTGLGVGVTTVITYTLPLPNGCFSIAPIVVDSLPDPIMGLDSICQGSTTTLTSATPSGIWSSSNGTLASVVATSGVTSGLLPGTVTISYTLVSGCYVTKAFKVRTPLAASVTISRYPDTIVCAGTPVMFVANDSNGGANPTFRWMKFTIDTAVGDTFTYIPNHGDFISVYMDVDSICAAPDPAYASVYMNVYPDDVSPIITISTTTTASTISYVGEVVTFYSDVTYGGSSPTYQWYRNDVAIPGATNSSYSTEVYTSGIYYCRVTGNAPCSAGTTGTSNYITIHTPDNVNSLALGSAEFALFPNPNTGAFTLSGEIRGAVDHELAIEVTNMLGQVVYRGQAMPKAGKVSHQVHLGGELAAGSYLMKVSSEAVNETFHFVISK